jgi:hypothetical protein
MWPIVVDVAQPYGNKAATQFGFVTALLAGEPALT